MYVWFYELKISKTSGDREKMEYNEPKSLLYLASYIIGIIIAKPALEIIEKYPRNSHISAKERKDLELLITRIAEYFDTLIPKPLHNIVTQQSLKYITPKFWFRYIEKDFNFLDIVLRSHTTNFDNCYLPPEMRTLLNRSLHRLKNLLNLKLDADWSRQGLMYATSAIENMKNLESFECLSCHDDLVKVVCDNCPLKKLIVSYSYVTDLSVPSILKLQNLVELDIYMSGYITKKSCVKILCGLPNLTVVYCTYLNSYLAQINSDSVRLPIQATKYHYVTEQDIMNLTKYCPLITKLDLIIRSGSKNVSSGGGLKHLKSLHIFSTPLQYAHVKQFLELKGDQLTKLHLYELDNISDGIANEIKHFCPNTKRLILNSQEY